MSAWSSSRTPLVATVATIAAGGLITAALSWLAAADRIERPGLIVAVAGAAITLLLALLTRMTLSSRRRAIRTAQLVTHELHEVEASSRRDAGMLAAILESIGDGVGVVDSQGRFLVHNSAAKAMLGIADDVSGPAPWQEHYGIFRPDGVTPFPTDELPLVRALSGQATDLVDMVIRNAVRPEGVTISVTGRPLDALASGIDGGGAVAIFHDVTHRRRLEAQLRAERDRYERLLRILSDLGEGVVMMRDSQIIYANDAYAVLSGYSVEELLALGSPQVLAADKQAVEDFAVIRGRLSQDRGAQPSLHLTRIRRKDGAVVPVETAAMRLPEQDGFSDRVFVIRDLTERRRAEIELAERAAALEEINAELQTARAAAEVASVAKSQFLATMSHEIRTPLNGVLGFTALLAETPDHPDAALWASTADTAGRALLDIVNDGLDLAKIEADSIHLEVIQLDLLEVARQAMTPSSCAAQEAGIELRLQPGDGLVKVRLGDPVRLRQIMTNLISNAVKFTPTGSVTLALDGSGERVTIRVIDTGIGISAEHERDLFVPYSQGRADTTRRYGGTGLGLAITHGLIRAMDGAITMTSRAGEGTTFTVEIDLPLAGALAAPQPPASDLAPHLTGMRVLVAEDNKANQLIAAAMLRKHGLHVDVVDDGEKAVSAVLSEPYDAVFMDCQMPVMDGLEATRQIRTHALGANLPIIALTANTFAEDRQACLNAGMSDFLPKPWTARQLTDALTRLVVKHDHHEPVG